MEASSGKEAILKNVRKALIHSTDIPYPGIEKTDFSFDGSQKDLIFFRWHQSRPCTCVCRKVFFSVG